MIIELDQMKERHPSLANRVHLLGPVRPDEVRNVCGINRVGLVKLNDSWSSCLCRATSS